jgi:hypothetical protein
VAIAALPNVTATTAIAILRNMVFPMAAFIRDDVDDRPRLRSVESRDAVIGYVFVIARSVCSIL